tara:strand:+ start:253 stop:786 length:534 start_codon:yes stop_codon:yes gene_type:complete
MKKKNSIVSIFIRYISIVLLGLGNLVLIYRVFTPLTVYPTLFILNALYGASLVASNVISFNGIEIELVTSCIAGAAYFLLIALNLATPMPSKTRLRSILFLVFTFLILNIFRILFFASLFNQGYTYFDLTHQATWYLGSTIFVILLWFVNIRIFKIKSIPIASDFKFIHSKIRKNKK